MRHRRGHVLPADATGEMTFSSCSVTSPRQVTPLRPLMISGHVGPMDGARRTRRSHTLRFRSATKWTADELGARLNLAMAERTALKITTIGAVDLTPPHEERREKEHRARQREYRRKERCRPRPAANRPRRTIFAMLPPVAEVQLLAGQVVDGRWLRRPESTVTAQDHPS